MTSVPRAQARPAALAIGVFDGVHRGHEHLIREMVSQAAADGLAPACITFDPDPEVVLHPERRQLALSTVEDRTRRLLDLGVTSVEVVPFTHAIAVQSPEEFLSDLRARYDLRALWVGSDFALGRERTGTIAMLRGIGAGSGFQVVVVEPLLHEGRRISATWIREALVQSDVGLCVELLGRPYCIRGSVVAGMSRGRQLGFPTANVLPSEGRALPADGVYLVRVLAVPTPRATPEEAGTANRYGVVNLGPRPTFDEHERLIETHILDYDGEIYGADLDVCFLERIRAIRRFDGVDELRAQIQRDVRTARERVSVLSHAGQARSIEAAHEC